MENASKALLIAGGVLIAMIITSFGVYLYGVYRGHSENMIAKMTEKEVTEFNAKFTVFEDRELTANEVVSILNLIRENNLNNQDSDYHIELGIAQTGNDYHYQSEFKTRFNFLSAVNNPSSNDSNFSNNCNTFIIESSRVEGFYFKCVEYEYSSKTGLINKLCIQFKKN